MGEDGTEKPGSVPGSGSASGPEIGDRGRPRVPATGPVVFEHERLEVYRVAREFLVLATQLTRRKMPRDLRDQFDRATTSILSNIGEGAGRTARADKQRFYEIARGSTTEAATQLDILHIRGHILDAQYHDARRLLVRVAQMLSRLSGSPRVT